MISLSYPDSWYDTRYKKPVLQLQILDLLSSHTSLSKSVARNFMSGHHLPDISDAFDELEVRKLIERKEVKRKRGHTPGKPPKYYRLTENGIAALILENPSPDRFWSLVMHYCYARDENEQVSLQMINDFYEFFSDRFFRFSSGRNSILMLDTLNDVCNDWLNRSRLLTLDEIKKRTVIDNMRVLAGHIVKVIELLVYSPDLTMDELSLRSGIPSKDLEEAMMTMTMPSNGMFVSTKIPLDRHYVSKFRQLFLEHCFIVSRETEQGKNFKLSIFGIILFLTYVHQNYRKSPSFIKTLTEYYDAIASNYGNLLPLILGKWSLQKSQLKYTAMDNFHVILDKERRYRSFSTSVVLEGTNEYYENMKNIIRRNTFTTEEIYNAGYDAFQEILSRRRTEERQSKLRSSKIKSNSNDTAKVESVARKIYEIGQLMKYKEAQTYVSELFRGQQMVSPIEIHSRSVQDEITFVYYLNLLKIYHGMDLPFLAKYVENPLGLASPHEVLAKILEEDTEINQWFSNWMKDIRQYENETFKIIKNYEETKHFVFKKKLMKRKLKVGSRLYFLLS